MDTTITINSGDNNSMESLSFLWKARFNDESTISQFENGIGHRFQEVKDRFQDLSYFYLIHKKLPICFTIDLINGVIFYNNHQSLSNELKIKKENIRLIYFRRITKEIGQNLAVQSTNIVYFLGFQYLDNLGNNRKILLQIDSNGNFIVGDN